MSHIDSQKRALQAQRMAGAKALRWEIALGVQGPSRDPCGWSEAGEGEHSGRCSQRENWGHISGGLITGCQDTGCDSRENGKTLEYLSRGRVAGGCCRNIGEG